MTTPVVRLDGTRFDVVGVGNALVDVIAHTSDDMVHAEGLVKGSMALVETERALHLHRLVGQAVQMSGGSAANTMCGLASLGGRAGYVGKVGVDDLGDVFGHDLAAVGVSFHSGRRLEGLPTGRCIVMVTPDAQRTMNTFLGVSSLLGPEDLDDEVVASAAVVYLEGYLFDRDDAKAAFRHAARVAHDAGRLVSLTLSDPFCVERHRSDFANLVADEVDVLFGNEEELLSLYRTDTLESAIAQLRGSCRLAAITLGARGSLVITPEDLIEVASHPVERVLDTTGAGDLYAAGFLYGMTQGLSWDRCGWFGSLAASEVISHLGPRPLVSLAELAASST